MQTQRVLLGLLGLLLPFLQSSQDHSVLVLILAALMPCLGLLVRQPTQRCSTQLGNPSTSLVQALSFSTQEFSSLLLLVVSRLAQRQCRGASRRLAQVVLLLLI